MAIDFTTHIFTVSDWPRAGITTYDIAPLLHDSALFRALIEAMAEPYLDANIQTVVGIEARGFILASALAYHLHAGVAMIRKKGKIPPPTLAQEYSFEYASNVMEIADGLIRRSERIILVDDILATGGTMAAAIKLANKIGADTIGISFAIEMERMAGRDRLKGQKIKSIISYA